MEDTQIVRRRIVRRRGASNGNAANGTDGNTGSNARTNSTSTVGGGNGDNVIGASSDGATDNGSNSDNRGNENSGMRGAVGSEDERTGGNRNGRSGDDDDGTIQFEQPAANGGNTGAGNRGSAARGNAEGKPKRVYRKRQKTQDAVSLKQDEEDICNILIAVGDGAANATGYDGFKIYQEEASSFARPAARILQRHGALAETIRSVADPLALIIAGASIAAPRIAGYSMFRKMQNFAPADINAEATEGSSGIPNVGNVVNFKDVEFARRFQDNG